MAGYWIGFELNNAYGQISFQKDGQEEMQTVETQAEPYQIPLVIALKDDIWHIGTDAVRIRGMEGVYAADDLYAKALSQEKIDLGDKTYEAVWLLAKYVEIALLDFKPVRHMVFTVPDVHVDVIHMLRGIGQRIGMEKKDITVIDNKESFFHYMFYQPKELWQYEAALFYCDRHEVRAYMLRKLRTGSFKGANVFVTVEEVASARMKELAAIYPVLNVDRARDADEQFRQFIQGVFNKKLVSSVFLIGEGFENNWYPASLKVLCNGRRAFLGNNLYSKGACYAAYRKSGADKEGPVYLDETKLTRQICIRMRQHGQDEWTPIVAWGTHWYEADTQLEVLLEEPTDMELHVESLTGSQVQVYTVSKDMLPDRRDYSIRLLIKVMFTDENTCKVRFQDMGFGEFFPPTSFFEEVEIDLGGNHGQFHSLS